MNRRTILIVTIIFSLLYIAYVLAKYHGYTRYATIKSTPLDKYVKKYASLPKAGGKEERVVVSLTTTPDRIRYISPTLKSILDQTLRVDEIALNIPYDYKGRPYRVPKQFRSFARIHRVGKCYGVANCLVPTLNREKEQETRIICVQDDKIYSKELVENLTAKSRKNPDVAVITSGSILVRPKFFSPDLPKSLESGVGHDWISKNLKCKTMEVKCVGTFSTK